MGICFPPLSSGNGRSIEARRRGFCLVWLDNLLVIATLSL
jgi:hypothetical protein